jgi:hypothetical protein
MDNYLGYLIYLHEKITELFNDGPVRDFFIEKVNYLKKSVTESEDFNRIEDDIDFLRNTIENEIENKRLHKITKLVKR